MKIKIRLIIVIILVAIESIPARCFHSTFFTRCLIVYDDSPGYFHNQIRKESAADEFNKNNPSITADNSPSLFDSVNYALVCVDSIWYEPGNKTLINVRVFNGDVNNLNYPSVQIVSPANDTIGNPNNFVTFFAQIGNTFTVYTDTITDTTITNFNNYKFLISEGFGDTTAVIDWCISTGINEIEAGTINLYPNPATDYIMIENPFHHSPSWLIIYNSTGELVLKKVIYGFEKEKINVSNLIPGIYFIILADHSKRKHAKLFKL